MLHDVICHVTRQQCTVDWSTVFSVARLPRSCKIIMQQSKMRNIDLNRALGNNIYYWTIYSIHMSYPIELNNFCRLAHMKNAADHHSWVS